LSIDELLVRDLEGERQVDTAELPLRIGTGSDCDVRLPGPGGGPVVLLDLLDGAPFVQPVGRDDGMSINGAALTTSRRLQDGDSIGFFGSRIQAAIVDGRLELDVRLEDSAYVTQPPEYDDAEASPAEETIAPAAFKRAAETSTASDVSNASRFGVFLSIALAVLAGASFLLFTSKSVKFEIEPGGADDVAIVGGWFRLPLGDRVLLRKGEYTVNVSKRGYYDISQGFIVDDDPNKTVEIELRRLPGQLTVRTNPATDAVVRIDEAEVGPAPLGPKELQPGEHSLRVQADRFLPYEGVVAIEGLGLNDVVTVQLVPRWSNVEITSEPAGATIYDGENALGETPAVVELLEGTHKITVLKDGYSAWDGTIVARPNVDQALPTISLEPANARLRVNTIPRGANVTVNGRYRGQSPVTLDLSPGIDYRIGMSKAGYGVTTRRVRLVPAASDAITVDLTATTGTVTVNVSPSDATVYVDGRARGRGSTTLELSAAPRRIEVRREGYESWSRTVTPRPGYPQTLSARLRSDAEVARASIATEVDTAAGQTLRRVEPGTFSLGASRAEQGRRANEVQVPVTLTKPFLIGTREVTNKEFAEFRANHDSGADVHAALAGDNNPVASVTWEEAVAYCNWLSAREGLTPVYKEEFGRWVALRPFPDGYRLPTEAEWAWAIRYEGSAGARRYAWGEDWPPRSNAGNYADQSARELVPTVIPGYDDGYASTAPVGTFPPNALGIHDGSGNVAEWVNDYYTVPTPGITTPVENPLGPEQGQSHVIRGPGWQDATASELRLSYRDAGTQARPDLGFRIARNAN